MKKIRNDYKIIEECVAKLQKMNTQTRTVEAVAAETESSNVELYN